MTSNIAAQNAPTLFEASTLRGIEDLAMRIGLRKISTQVEEIFTEGGQVAEQPVTQAAVAAIINNPWLKTGVDQDLQPETERIAPVLAKIMTDRAIDALGSAENVEAFGKGAIVGLGGQLEHAGALIHTPFFGNLVREILGGTSIICFSDERAAAGTSLRVPMWHKTAAATRSHYQSFSVTVPDAPHEDEIAIIVAVSSGPRPHHRIGDRTTDKPVSQDILKGIVL